VKIVSLKISSRLEDSSPNALDHKNQAFSYGFA